MCIIWIALNADSALGISQMLTGKLSSAQSLFPALSNLLSSIHFHVGRVDLSPGGTRIIIKSIHWGMRPTWPRVLHHIHIITAAVSSQQTNRDGCENNTTWWRLPHPRRYFQMEARSIQLVRFTTAQRRKILYKEWFFSLPSDFLLC